MNVSARYNKALGGYVSNELYKGGTVVFWTFYAKAVKNFILAPNAHPNDGQGARIY